jgi:hypothetical protein
MNLTKKTKNIIPRTIKPNPNAKVKRLGLKDIIAKPAKKQPISSAKDIIIRIT